jgi:hypothetical protein
MLERASMEISGLPIQEPMHASIASDVPRAEVQSEIADMERRGEGSRSGSAPLAPDATLSDKPPADVKLPVVDPNRPEPSCGIVSPDMASVDSTLPILIRPLRVRSATSDGCSPVPGAPAPRVRSTSAGGCHRQVKEAIPAIASVDSVSVPRSIRTRSTSSNGLWRICNAPAARTRCASSNGKLFWHFEVSRADTGHIPPPAVEVIPSPEVVLDRPEPQPEPEPIRVFEATNCRPSSRIRQPELRAVPQLQAMPRPICVFEATACRASRPSRPRSSR